MWGMGMVTQFTCIWNCMHEINNIDKCIKNVEKSMKISIVHHSHLTKYTLFFQEINLLKLEYMHVKIT